MRYARFSRRSFIGATAAISAASVAATLLPHSKVYAATIYGDGKHDDTDGLQALFDGLAVNVAAPGVVARSENGAIYLLNGSFHISRPLKVRENIDLYADHCTFRVGKGPKQPYLAVA